MRSASANPYKRNRTRAPYSSAPLGLPGLSPESFSFGSLVACKPPQPLPGQVYEFSAPQHCSEKHLGPFIENQQPKCIVALGPVAARALTGLSGEKLTLDMIRGYVVPGIGVAEGFPVICAPSPSYIMNGMSHEMSMLVMDLKKAQRTSRIPDDPEVEQYYLHVHGTKAEARAQGKSPLESFEFMLEHIRANPRLIVVYDFEFIAAAASTTKKRTKISLEANITQVNFTVIDMADRSLLTMVADWNTTTKDIAIAILQTANVKVSYNGYHCDEHVARYNDFEITGSEMHDGLWMVHFLWPDLPARRAVDDEEFLTGEDGSLMALQVAASFFDFPAPWKHLNGKDPHFYGARDTHATAVVFLGAIAEMQRRGSYGTYDYFVRKHREALKKAERQGYPMSRKALGDLQDFTKTQIVEANAKIQDLVPPDLKPFVEKRPVNDKQVEALLAQHGTNIFKREVYSEDKCECGKAAIGEPAAGCPDCKGSGYIEGRRVKCKTCSKHALVPPAKDTDRWSCEWCKWVDTTTPEELLESFNTGGKPKMIKTYFKTKHDDDIRAGRYLCPTCKNEGLENTEKPCTCVKRMVYDPLCSRCHGAGVVKGMVPRYCIRLPFNPNSPDQLKRYAQARNHTVPRSGMGRDGIAQLARQTGDPVYNVLHQIKTLEAISGVMAPLTARGALLSDDASDVERIHTHFMFTDAAGSISSKYPDIITAPPAHRYPGIAEIWNRCLVTNPTPDTRLVRLDCGPLELEMFALEARDEGLLSIIPTAETWLLETAKFKKTVQGVGAIAAIYRGFMNATAATTIYQKNRHLFAAVDTVAYLLSKLDYHFPRCVEYRLMQANQAHKQGYLRSLFGYERQFYSVLRRGRDGAGAPEPSIDYGNAVSFMSRNHAACVIAIVAMGVGVPPSGVQLISPTENAFGSNGLLLEVPNEGTFDVPTFTAKVLVRPDGSTWSPTITIKDLLCPTP